MPFASEDVKNMLLDPANVFERPAEVVRCDELSHETKIDVLNRWAYDVRELRVAEDEGMQGRTPVTLEQILDALHELGAEVDLDHGPPTEHGGF